MEFTSPPSQNLSVTGDAARLAALRDTELLDSLPEEVFDRMTRLAAKLVSAPATFISLVDEKRDFYKSCVGFGEPLATVRQLEGTTLCHYAISGERPLVIPDTRADPLYRKVPTVESLGVAAYLGVPIRTAEGHALGTFCAIDFQPREWTGTEVEVMVELAASAEREITLRRDVTRQRQASERTHFQAQLLDSVGEAVIATDPAGTITYWNRAAEQLYGWAGGETLGRGIVEVTPAALSKAQATEIVGQLAAGQRWAGEFAVMKRDGTQFPAWVTNTPITDASGTVTGIVGVSRDLTAWKETEAVLRESEERYRSIFEGAAEGFFLVGVESDGGFRYVAMNAALERISDIPRDRFIGLGPGEVLPPDAAARESALYRRAVGTGEPVETEHTSELPRGRVSTRTRLYPLRDPKGRITQILGMVEDITERQQADEARWMSVMRLRQFSYALAQLAKRRPGSREAGDDLREVTELAAQTLDVDRAGVWMFAEGGAVLRCHDLYQRRGDVHTAGAELQGSDHPRYFRALAEERVIAARDARTDPRTGEFAEAYLAPLGITSRMDVPIQLEGRTVGVLCHEHAGPPRIWTIEEQTFAASLAAHISLALEVAQRRSAEAELRESETRLAQTLEAVPAGVFVVNASGVPEYANQRAQQILGRGIVAGTKADDFPEVYQAFVAGTEEPYPVGRMPVVRALAGEALAVEDMEIRRPDRVVPLHVEAAPLRDTEDRVVAAVAVFVDVTETRRLEEQLRQAVKMEAVGRLAGGVAHDFNNLLTVISGNTELRLADAPAGSSAREDLEEILHAAHRAAELTRQLLAFSRQQVLKPKLLYLADSLRGMQRMLPRLLGEDIELTIRAEPDAGPVMADPAQIEQVILNLAINARDAMPRGGLLQIETCNARLTAEDSRKYPDSVPGDYALLKVCDSGEGISPEVLKHIFDPFFTTKEPGKGTGLGLATVFGIVQQSGGYIWVDSTPGSGTTFRIYLPRTEEPKSTVNETQAKPDAKWGNETILLVEDEEQVRRFAGRVLRRVGYTVREASGGEEALRLLGGEDAPPDLLLTDLVMSGMSGRELAEAMTEQHPSMAVLYMSGYTEDAVVQRGVREESVDFIQKPFSPDDLARRVREVLDRPESGPST